MNKKEFGVQIKLNTVNADQLQKLRDGLQAAGVDTAQLDAKAAELGAELVRTGGASATLADAERKLAPVARAAAEATDELAKAASDSTGGLTRLAGSSEDAKAKLGAMKVELAAAGAAAYTIGRALGTAARDASTFETNMAEVATLVEDTKGMDAQAEAVRRLAREYGGSAPDQAKALYQVISAGAAQGAESIDLLNQANKLAVGGVTDITTAVDGLTSVMNAYGESAGTSQEVSDAFFVAMKAGKTTVGELSKSIGQVAPISAQAGVGLGELLSATAALTKGGTSTSESMTQLRAILTAVIKPSKEAADTAEALGLKFDAQALKAKGLSGFLNDVAKATGGNTETVAKLFGSVEALGAVLALTGNQAKDFKDILGQMADRTGATDVAFKKIAETSGFAAKRWQAAVEDISISAGQALTAFTPLLEAVTSAINVFNNLPGPVKTVAAGVGALALAAAPAVLAVNSLVKAVGLAGTALGLQGAAAAAAAAPIAAAATATSGLAVAAAATVAPATAAAGATGVLAGAVAVLGAGVRALLGPLGLLLTAVGLVVPEFLRAKAAAEQADVANRKMLEGPAKSELAAKAKEAADRTAELAEAAARSNAALAKQEVAAQQAAKVLGVDLVLATKGVSAEFDKQAEAFDALFNNLEALRAKGVDTGSVVRQALAKLIDSASTETEVARAIDALKRLGVQGNALNDVLTKAFDKKLTLAKTEADVQSLVAAVQRVQRETGATGKAFDDFADKAGIKARQLGGQLEKDLAAFGLKSRDELQRTADSLAQAWDRIKLSTQVALADKIKAFAQYHAAAVAANDGVETSELKLQRAQLESQAVAAGAGEVYTKAMAAASRAIDGTRGKVNELKNTTSQTYAEIFRDQARYERALRESAAYGPGANAGLGSLGGSQEARNATVKSTIQSDFSIDQKSGTIGSVYTPPPDNSGDYEWVSDAANPGGRWQLTAAGSARRTAENNAQLAVVRSAYQAAGVPLPSGGIPTVGLPAAVRAQLQGTPGNYSLMQPTATPSAAPMSASATAVDGDAAAGSSAEVSRLVAAVGQLVTTLKGSSGSPQVLGRYEIAFRAPNGATVSAFTESQQQAAFIDELLRSLERGAANLNG